MSKGKRKAKTASTVAAAEGVAARTINNYNNYYRTRARMRASQADEDIPPTFSQAQQEWIEQLIESRVANSNPQHT